MNTEVNNSKISGLFDSWAGQERGERMAKGHDELVRHVFDNWEITDQESILDVGCGNGRALSLSKQYGIETHAGIDISPKMIEKARLNVPKGDFSVGKANPLPWNDSSFSRIISIEAAYYFDDPLASFKEFRRVLKKGGKFAIVIEFFLENKGSHVWEKQLPFKVNLLSENDWSDLLRKAGFADVRFERIIRKTENSEFTPSPFFPTRELYDNFMESGALKLFN